jgi:hypothetical protein
MDFIHFNVKFSKEGRKEGRDGGMEGWWKKIGLIPI